MNATTTNATPAPTTFIIEIADSVGTWEAWTASDSIPFTFRDSIRASAAATRFERETGCATRVRPIGD